MPHEASAPLPRSETFRVKRPVLVGGIPVMFGLYACLIVAFFFSPLARGETSIVASTFLALVSAAFGREIVLFFTRGVAISSPKRMVLTYHADALQQYLAFWRDRGKQEHLRLRVARLEDHPADIYQQYRTFRREREKAEGYRPQIHFYLAGNRKAAPLKMALEAMAEEMGIEAAFFPVETSSPDLVSVYVPTQMQEESPDAE